MLLYLLSSFIVLNLTFLNDYLSPAEPVRTFTLILRLYLQTRDIFDKLRQQHSTYAIAIVTLELETIATERKRIACNLPYENQLFGYIHYWTEININLLLNTCNFDRKIRPFIFSLNLSENTQNVHFREDKFQNFLGQHAPDPPSALAPLALDLIFAGLTLNCFRRACYYQWVILSIILRVLNYTKRCFFLSVRKGCTFPRLLTWGPLKLKLHTPPPHPPPKKLRTRLPYNVSHTKSNC